MRESGSPVPRFLVSRQLLRELRIFCGVNALAFALLGLISHKRRGRAISTAPGC